jgi:NADH:ubiquinone reductase (non-electrogenic)
MFLLRTAGLRRIAIQSSGRHFARHLSSTNTNKKTLVILGSGWGSVSLLKKINTTNYNVVVVSPRNFFLFTPLLPSSTTGAIEHRSIMEPIRNIISKKESDVTYYEARAEKIDYASRTVTIHPTSEEGATTTRDINFDYLVIGVGATTSTFGIPGVKEHAHFLKEIPDAQKIRKRIIDCVEAASFKSLDDADRSRLLHTVVVGGGPTGVEFAAELQDFFDHDIKKRIPSIAKDFRITLIEALPNLLPSFSERSIDFTERAFKDEKIAVLANTKVKNVTSRAIFAETSQPDGSRHTVEMPYGLLVWAAGNTMQPVVRDFMANIDAQKSSKRGPIVTDHLGVEGTQGIWALGDCTSTKYAQTAQVASQQGTYLGSVLNQMARSVVLEQDIQHLKSIAGKKTDIEAKSHQLQQAKMLPPFDYNHRGSLAYVGADKAVADLPLWNDKMLASCGRFTFLLWRSAYLSMCLSMRNRVLVVLDWCKVKVFGRDLSRSQG